jgi:serine/threonine protein kinase
MLASIVTAFMRGGDLNRVLKAEVRHRHRLSWNGTAKSKVIYGIAAGVSYLPTVHQDLKPSNSLVNESFEPYLSDFGFSRVVGWNSAPDYFGSVLFMDPERFPPSSEVTLKSDVFSFEMVQRDSPGFHGTQSMSDPSLAQIQYRHAIAES